MDSWDAVSVRKLSVTPPAVVLLCSVGLGVTYTNRPQGLTEIEITTEQHPRCF